MKAKLRRAMLVTHLWLGLGLGLYLCVVCATGSVLMFAPEYARWRDPQIFSVSATGRPASLEQVRASVKVVFPKATPDELRRFRTFPEWNGLHRFQVSQPQEGTYVYVDPHTARVRGAQVYSQTFLGQVDALHANLALGVPGFIANGVGGILSSVLLLSGVWLWWPRSWKALRESLTVKRGTRGRRLWLDWHNVLGMWSLPLLFVVIVTGSALIFAPPFGALVAWLTRSPTDVPVVQAPTRAGALVSTDVLIRSARQAVPDAPHLFYTQTPSATDTKAKNEPAEVTLYREDGVGVTTWATVYLDARTGRVLKVYDTARETLGRRVTGPIAWGLHVGNWGRDAVRWLYFALGLVPTGLFVTGVWLWWRKKSARLKKRAQSKEIAATA